MARNFFALGVGDGLARLIAFGATVYLARVLGADGYGVVALAAGIVLYLAQIADFGIEAIGIREIAQDPLRLGTLGPPILGARLALAGVVAVLTAAMALTLLPAPEGPVLAAYSLTLLPVALSTRWVHLGNENARPVAIARVAGEAVMLTLVLAAVRDINDVIRVPFSQFAGDLAAALFLLYWIARSNIRLGIGWDPGRASGVLRRASPLVAHALFGLLIYNSDLVFIRVLIDRTAVGYYAAAYTFISFLLNLGVAYMNSLLPTLTRQGAGSDGERRFVVSSYAVVFAAGLPTAIGGALLAERIIATIFGPAYEPAAAALGILIWSIPISLFRNVGIAALIARDRQDLVLRTTTGSVVANLILNFALIPILGIVGAAVATVVTEAIRSVLSVRYVCNAGLPGLPVARFWKPVVSGITLAAVILLLPTQNLWVLVASGAAAYLGAMTGLGALVFDGGKLPSIRL